MTKYPETRCRLSTSSLK